MAPSASLQSVQLRFFRIEMGDRTELICMEICVDSLASVQAVDDIVRRGRDNRYEVCSNLLNGGGLTPSIGLIRSIRREFPHATLMVMIRPRQGDFVWTRSELETMRDDIEAFADEGVHGIVIGCLTPEGDIDLPACQVLLGARRGLAVTFHRAIDVTRDWESSLHDIIGFGHIARVLTSGQAASVTEGRETLERMVEFCQTASHQRATTPTRRASLAIIAGAGVNERTLGPLLDAVPGLTEVHLTASSAVMPRQPSDAVRRGASFGFGTGEVWTIDREKVQKVWEIISERNARILSKEPTP